MDARTEGMGVDLPRWQAGGNPQHLLVTILGDFWLGRPEYLPSAALVEQLADFGTGEESARATLSRLQRRGVLATVKMGRNTFYRFEDAVSLQAADKLAALMTPDTDADGDDVWTLCAFSLPEGAREVRALLRAHLRGLGFTPLYDGLWVAAGHHQDRINSALDELGVTGASVFTATEHPSAGRAAVAEAWDLTAVREAYEQFFEKWVGVPDLVRSGAVAPREAMVLRVSMMDAYRHLIALDPGLPTRLLPADWPRRRAQALLVECYDGLAELAELRLRALVAPYSPVLAELVHAHPAATLLRGSAGLSECPRCLPREAWAAQLESYLTR